MVMNPEWPTNDPLTYPYFYDDFISGNAWQAGPHGMLGWVSINSPLVQVAATSSGTTGIGRLIISGSTVGTVYAINLAGGTTNDATCYFSDLSHLRYRAAGTITSCDLRVGVMSNVAANPPVNGIYFEKLAADTTWFTVTRASSTQTRTDTGVGVSGGWQMLSFIHRGSTIDFYIDGALENTHSANIPAGTVSAQIGWHVIPTTTGSRNIEMDWFDAWFKPQKR